MASIVESRTFEEKMKDRIKESIGDLIGDEDLKKLLDAAMYDVFFKPSKVKISSWESKDGPSFLQEIVKELMEEKVRDEVRAYINSHEDVVNKIVSDIVTEGVGLAMMRAMSSIFQSQMYTFEANVRNQLANKGL